MKRALIVAFVLLICLAGISRAQQSRRMFRVSVDITADEVIKAQIISGVNGGLRRLGDVVMTDDDVTLHISLVVAQAAVIEGHTMGYAVSIVVTKSELDQGSIRSIVKVAAKDEASARMLNEMFGSGVTLIYHSVLTGGSNLDELCKRVVAELDARPIEAERKYWQDIADHANKIQELRKKYPNKSYSELDQILESERKRPE